MVRFVTISVLTFSLSLAMCLVKAIASIEPVQIAKPANQNVKQEIQSGDANVMLPSYQRLPHSSTPVELPMAAGSWALELETSGGLTGTRKSYLLISSEGEITTDDSQSLYTLKLSYILPEINDLINRTQFHKWSTRTTDLQMISLCQECYKTTLTLYRRESDGTKSGYRAYWDDTTGDRLIKEVNDLYMALEKIKQGLLDR